MRCIRRRGFALGDIPVVINLPGEPNPRYPADLRQADALVADGWAARASAGEARPPGRARAEGRRRRAVPSRRTEPARRRFGSTDKRVVVAVARLVPIKNVRLLVDAMAHRPRAASPDAHLLIVGDGPERAALRARAAALDLADAVTFVGSVPQRETPASIGPPTCSRSRPISTTRRTSCSRRWPAACRSSPPTSAACASSCRTAPAAPSCRRETPPALAARSSAISRIPTRPRARRRAQPADGVDRVLVARERAAAARRLPTASSTRAHGAAPTRASRMKVAIRDDDTCYFTTPDALERVYGDVWDRVPVCLATVPFAIGYEQPGIPARTGTRANRSRSIGTPRWSRFCAS